MILSTLILRELQHQRTPVSHRFVRSSSSSADVLRPDSGPSARLHIALSPTSCAGAATPGRQAPVCMRSRVRGPQLCVRSAVEPGGGAPRLRARVRVACN